jgi:hypothetical protein
MQDSWVLSDGYSEAQSLVLAAQSAGSRRSRSKPDRGILHSYMEVLNQNGETVMSMKAMNLLECRESPSSTPRDTNQIGDHRDALEVPLDDCSNVRRVRKSLWHPTWKEWKHERLPDRPHNG